MQNNNFENYYYAIYNERWPHLRECLLKPSESVPYSHGLVKPYLLDYASVLAAKSLRLPESGIILDTCAAPGGKSLVLASLMNSETSLVSNELSSQRRRILITNLDDHLDNEKRNRVFVTSHDAAKMGSRKNELMRYSAILLDAPCSSERHVIQSEKALSQWTAARPRFLSQRQWSLLSAAFLLLKEGGSLIYSTCAINPEENDNVVRRLFEKYGNNVLLDAPDFDEGEKTLYGKIILPDVCSGMGPMYVARVKKITAENRD